MPNTVASFRALLMTSAVVIAAASALLLEDGVSFLLMENGSKILLE